MASDMLMYMHLLLSRITYKITHPLVWMTPVFRASVHNPYNQPANQRPCYLPHGVILGSCVDACSVDLFRTAPVLAVVNATPDVPCFFAHDGVAYVKFPIHDNANASFTASTFERASAFISKHTAQGCNVLVHCVMGRSRSVCICCYHFMKQHKLPFREIYQLILQNRPQVHVNLNFFEDLAREFPHDSGLSRFIESLTIT